jgi:hypothetical protein
LNLSKDTNMGKEIQLPNGSIIRREATSGYDEEWIMQNKSTSTLEITLDVSNCTGTKVEGHEGKDKAIATCPPSTTQTLFIIHRTPPFRFAIGITMEEKPTPLKQQTIDNQKKKTKMEQKIDEMSEFMQKIPFDAMDHDAIIEKLDEFGLDHFLDPSFPPTDTSIYDKESEPKYPLQQKPVWKRPHEFMKDPQLFCDGIDPNDINQGALGNCWFLASIASVAENPALIRRLFITQEYNRQGLYQLRICKNGEWVKVTVDDYIPCHNKGGPMFCRATGDELWVLLLEKAYAKLHGNYVQLRAGFVSHGMADLTGCPTRDYKFPKEKQDYSAIKAFADDLWEKVTYADSRGWIMCAGTAGVDKFTEGGGPDQETGIVPGHAYSVIAAQEHADIKLLNVRNPWGQFEWGGAWSDNSKEWTKPMKKAFKPNFNAKDGSFWISYEDFLKNFCSVTVCKVENWNEVRLKGIFMRLMEAQDADEDFVLSKFYYSFRLEEETTIEVGLHQEDERILGSDRRRYIDMQILILKRHTNGTLSIEHDSGSKCDRDNELHVTLGAGFYILVPRTSGAALSRPNVDPKDPVDLKVQHGNREMLHPVVRTTLDDIFRRMDLQLNGSLSAGELNQLGQLVGDENLSNLTSDDLAGEHFENISCNADGITNYGLKQLFRRTDPSQVLGFLEKLGYDESLYSTKSKPFTVTFHTNSKLRVRIGDALATDLNERAWDLMMHKYHAENGATGAIQTKDICIFRRYDAGAYCVAYGAVNKTDDEIEVNFNMTKSKKMIFQPKKGTVKTICPPRGLVYLATSILDPGESSFSWSYSFTARRT